MAIIYSLLFIENVIFIYCRKAISKSCQDNNDLLHPKHAEIGYRRRELKSYVDWTVSSLHLKLNCDFHLYVLYRCNILIHPPFSSKHRGYTHLCMTPGLHASFSMYRKTRGGGANRNGASVYICMCRMVIYCTDENVTLVTNVMREVSA